MAHHGLLLADHKYRKTCQNDRGKRACRNKSCGDRRNASWTVIPSTDGRQSFPITEEKLIKEILPMLGMDLGDMVDGPLDFTAVDLAAKRAGRIPANNWTDMRPKSVIEATNQKV
ncbi:MAG TPA: hypothetical protein VE176_04720 [Candidatus Limnocylindrales bacterium]|nr:hypothetical protein [Candidatus Limnocylindrales bacterium]